MGKEEKKNNQIDNEIDLLLSALEQRAKKKTDKSKIWLDLFNKHKDFIFQSLEKGFKKSDLYYAFSEIVKKKYGKTYMIKPNYFYLLLRKFLSSLNETNPPKKNLKNKISETSKSEQNSPDKKISNLEEFNKGGVL